MKKMMKKIFVVMMALCICMTFIVPAFAEQNPTVKTNYLLYLIDAISVAAR